MTRLAGRLLLAGLLLTPQVAAAAGDLTLRDVMELHRTGLGDDLLIAVIDADGGPFRLGFADIQDLKSDGLSERVIAALVRTGARQPLAADGAEIAVESVPAYQEVVPFVPALVVVGVPVLPVDVDGPRGHARHGDRASRPQTPPATWVTRRDDGTNVPASRDNRPPVPPAAWVTPRDPQPQPTRTVDAGRPTPR